MSSEDVFLSEQLPWARVHQIAEATSQSVADVVTQLNALGVDARSGSERIAWEPTHAILDRAEPVGDVAVARGLVSEAFLVARASGKPDWQIMTGAVLKNRLLDLTNHGFRETDYGAPSMGYFVRKFPDLLVVMSNDSGNPHFRVNETALPAEKASAALPTPTSGFVRLRDDLWRAFFDYRNHPSYVWDLDRGEAVAGGPGPGRILIPSMTVEDDQKAREEFVASVKGVADDAALMELESWVANRSGSNALPPAWRGRWNGHIRDLILERATKFFADNDLTLPANITVSKDDRSRPRSVDGEIRDFVNRCIAAMTSDELAELRFAPQVVLRAGYRP